MAGKSLRYPSGGLGPAGPGRADGTTGDSFMSTRRCRIGEWGGMIVCLLVLGGCARTPSGEPVSSVIGSSKQEVERAWGKPVFSFHDQDGRERIVYRHTETGLSSTVPFIIPIHEKTSHFCYLLEVDENGIVEDYDAPFVSSFDPMRHLCLAVLFRDDWSMARYLASTYGVLDPLTARAMRGDVAAAVLLAEEYGETYQLLRLAEKGNPAAAYALLGTTVEDSRAGPTVLLRALCDAAQGDDGGAQLHVAELLSEAHWEQLSDARRAKLRAAGFFPADVVAYFWYRQAARNGAPGAEARLAELAATLSSEDIVMAQRWGFDPLTEWERSPAAKLFSPSATGCPMPTHDRQDLVRIRHARLEALSDMGDAWAAVALGDTGTLERLANNGDAAAAAIMALEYDNPRYALALAEIDPEIGLHVYRRLSKEQRASPDGWRWLCQSANAGSADARREVGYWHRTDRRARAPRSIRSALERSGVAPDDAVAYAWYLLAGAADATAGKPRVPERLRRNLSSTDTVRGERLAREWRPGDCPSATRRLAPPGET